MWNDSIPDLVDELFDEPGPHGEPRETALMTHIAGELVHEDQLTEARDGTMPPRKTDYTTAQKLLTISSKSPTTCLWRPDRRYFRKGRQLFVAATDQLVQLLE